MTSSVSPTPEPRETAAAQSYRRKGGYESGPVVDLPVLSSDTSPDAISPKGGKTDMTASVPSPTPDAGTDPELRDRPAETADQLTAPDEQAAEEAAVGQQRARALWESLPVGTPVVVEFLGSGPRRARRTEIGWESDDHEMARTGCTPWSVRVEEVWLRADSDFSAALVLARERLAAVEALCDEAEREPTSLNAVWTSALRAVLVGRPPTPHPTQEKPE